MISTLLRSAVLVSALAALSGCASVPYVTTTTAFQNRPKPEDLICTADKVTVKVSVGNGLTPEDSFLTQMETLVTDALYARKKYSQCVLYVPRNFILDMKITRLTENGRLAGLLSPKIDKILFDGDFVLSEAAPKNNTLARFSMKNAFVWGCPLQESHFMWGLFASNSGRGGECGSATSLSIIENNFAEELAKVIVVTPTPPPEPASDTKKADKPGDGNTDNKSAKEKPVPSK